MGSFTVWHWVILAVFYCGVAFAIVAARRKARLLAASASENQPKGLGGWLILVIVGQFVGIIRLLMGIGESSDLYKTDAPAAAVHMIIALDAALLMLLVAVTVAIFRKKRSFPVLYSYQALAAFLAPALSAVFLSQLLALPLSEVFSAEMAHQMLVALTSGVIWIWYVLVSIRVRNTFVN